MMKVIREKAAAKINLQLHILGLRSDGFHELESIMQSVDLCDEITLRPSKEIRLRCSDPRLPSDKDNLMWQAAEAIRGYCSLADGVEMELLKKIPAAAGLAGGSSDAAAVLRGMDRLYDLRLSTEEFRKIAADLGSDVAFCLQGGTALCQGRGEILTPLSASPDLWAVLVNPGHAVSTGDVYRQIDIMREARAGEIEPARGPRAPFRRATEEMIRAITDGDSGLVRRLTCNDLQPVTLQMYPRLEKLAGLLSRQGDMTVLMSGSGPTFIGLTEDRRAASEAARVLNAQAGWAVAAAFTKKEIL